MTDNAIAKEIDAAFRMQTTLGPGLLNPFILNRFGNCRRDLRTVS